jgi:hypothetical protein
MVHGEAFLNMVHGKHPWNGRIALMKVGKDLSLAVKQIRLIKNLGVT